MRSIRQSVQNGQFLCRLAQNASHLLVASHTDKRIELFLVRVIAAVLAINQTKHPELVAQRIERYASLVGRERVIAGTGYSEFSLALVPFTQRWLC